MRAAGPMLAFGCVVALGCEVILGPNDYGLLTDAGTEPALDAATDGATDAPTAPDAEGPVKVEVLAVGQSEPRGLAVDGERVYWANQGSNTVVSVPKSGPDRKPLFFTDAAVSPRWVGVDATQVYWPSDTKGGCTKGIVKQPKDGGGDPTVLASCTDVLARINGFGMDGAQVYWTTHPSATALFAVPKQGGGILTLANGLGGQPDALAVAPDAVYFNNPPLETVSRFDKATQAVTMVARGHKGLAAVATDGTHVYFATLVAVHRALGTTVVDPDAGADAGPFAETLATGQDSPAGVAVFGDHVYFTTAGSGTVARTAKTGGGAVEVLAADQPGARSIVVDDSGVYFTRDTGEIMRLVR